MDITALGKNIDAFHKGELLQSDVSTKLTCEEAEWSWWYQNIRGSIPNKLDQLLANVSEGG